MVDLLIRNCGVLTMDQDFAVLTDRDVAISGQRIEAIEPTGRIEREAGRVIEARGQLLMPGLVNGHTHVGMAYFKGTAAAMPLFEWLEWGWRPIRRMTEDDIAWSARLSCAEMIRHGVTTFNDMYFSVHRIAEAVAESGLRACLSESIMEAGPGMEERMPLEDQIAAAQHVARDWHGAADGRIRVFMAPHSVYLVSQPTMARILAMAEWVGTRLHIHLSETEPEVRQSLAAWGVRPPQRLADLGVLDHPILAAHAVHLDDEDIALLDRPTVGLSHNPASNLKLQSGRARAEDLVGRQLAVALGSDGSGSNDTLDILKEVHLAAIQHPWRQEQRPAHAALAMATREGARALGLEAEIGTVEVGKKADLILVDLGGARNTPVHDPHLTLAFTARGADVTTTIVDGRVLMEDGHIETLDEAAVLAEARERTARIFGSHEAPATPA